VTVHLRFRVRGPRIRVPLGAAKYPIGVHVLPKHLDEKVARLQLKKLSAELTLVTDRGELATSGVPRTARIRDGGIPFWAGGCRAAVVRL
jgi:hypothetical protein